jgi:hypothetical protein
MDEAAAGTTIGSHITVDDAIEQSIFCCTAYVAFWPFCADLTFT